METSEIYLGTGRRKSSTARVRIQSIRIRFNYR